MNISGYSVCERPHQQGIVHVEARPKGCLPFNTNTRVQQEVPHIQLAGQSLRVHSSSFWDVSLSKDIYKDPKTSASNLESCMDTYV